MSGGKRPSTSSLRRFITSRSYIPVAELRRRFGLDEPDTMAHLQRNGTSAWIGLPEREAAKVQDLWDRDELGLELSVEVRAPVVVGIYPTRIARYVMENGGNGNGAGHANGNGYAAPRSRDRVDPQPVGNGGQPRSHAAHAPRPMAGAPSYWSAPERPAPRPDGG